MTHEVAMARAKAAYIEELKIDNLKEHLGWIDRALEVAIAAYFDVEPLPHVAMDRSQQFEDGFRHALGRCVTWLHERANLMNDPHARAILNSAANALGCHGFTKGKQE